MLALHGLGYAHASAPKLSVTTDRISNVCIGLPKRAHYDNNTFYTRELYSYDNVTNGQFDAVFAIQHLDATTGIATIGPVMPNINLCYNGYTNCYYTKSTNGLNNTNLQEQTNAMSLLDVNESGRHVFRPLSTIVENAPSVIDKVYDVYSNDTTPTAGVAENITLTYDNNYKTIFINQNKHFLRYYPDNVARSAYASDYNTSIEVQYSPGSSFYSVSMLGSTVQIPISEPKVHIALVLKDGTNEALLTLTTPSIPTTERIDITVAGTSGGQSGNIVITSAFHNALVQAIKENINTP